jgi:hypothetical protein
VRAATLLIVSETAAAEVLAKEGLEEVERRAGRAASAALSVSG